MRISSGLWNSTRRAVGRRFQASVVRVCGSGPDEHTRQRSEQNDDGLTTTVAVVFVASKLTFGAWVVILTVPR